jgi:hypothetical protein
VLAALLGAVTAVFHLIAAAALVLFVLVMAIARRERCSAFVALYIVAGVAAGTRLAGQGPTMMTGLGDSLRANVAAHGLRDGVVATFRVSSTPLSEKLEQVVAQVLGPFPRAEKLFVAAIVLVVIALEIRARRAAPDAPDAPASTSPALSGVRVACAALALAALLAPGAIQVPDDICLLDFRLITTAAIVGIAAIPPAARRLAPRRVLIFASAVGVVLLVWFRQLAGAASEVTQMTRLIDRLAPPDRLLALSMHDASAYLDENNAVLHYAAVYHTARSGGVTSLFWGKFTPRLPIGFRAGQEPKRPPDWSPWLVTDEELADFSHLIIRAPEPDDDAVFHDLNARLAKMSERGDVVPIATDGACTLFRVAHRTAGLAAPP